LDLQDWHKKLEMEARLTKRAQDRASAPPKPLPVRGESVSVPSAVLLPLRESDVEEHARTGGLYPPPRKGRGPRKEESREELISRLLDPTLTLDETARLLEVCPTTVRRWTNKGALPCERSAGNQRRFKWSSSQNFLRSREGDEPEMGEE
jgi:excisionase family DNA binding protein